MMTDAELKRCLNDYECESLPQMLREIAAQSKWCTTVEGGRIPTWPLHEAAERLEAIAAAPHRDGWQDIATAPRDEGQLILGHSEQRWIRFGRYYPEFRKWYYSGTNERQQYSETEGGVPTHWRSLPKPPAPPAAELERTKG